jgi:hypothetical protein
MLKLGVEFKVANQALKFLRIGIGHRGHLVRIEYETRDHNPDPASDHRGTYSMN